MLVDEGVTAKESIPELLRFLARRPDYSATQALETLGLEMISEDRLKIIIEEIVENNLNLINERGMSAMGSLMGIAMSKLRGRVQPQMVQKMLHETIKIKLS